MRYYVFILMLTFSLIFNIYPSFGQKKNPDFNRPKLVVGIIVDQMRSDFLNRYYDRLSDAGFKKLLREGVYCTNTLYNYLPTNTAPGHSSIFSGSTPAIHGITDNNWYDKITNKTVYCTEDSNQKCVGCDHADGKMSPHHLKVTCVADQIKLAQGYKGKTIGISIKDRGAIFTIGKSGDAAYWMESDSAYFITSSYYMDQLPTWVKQFNQQKLGQLYTEKKWETLYPINTYVQSDMDNQKYEDNNFGAELPVFPHQMSKGKNNNYDMIRTSPFGNQYITDFTLAALEGEQLGGDEFTDFLSVSFSCTDYIGHDFGPNSIETEDSYLRLDKDIERIINYLDQHIGQENYLLVMTADHGICDIAGHSHHYTLPGGVVEKDVFTQKLNQTLNEHYGDDKYFFSFNKNTFAYYVNFDLLKEKKIDYNDFFNVIKKYFLSIEGIAQVIDLNNIGNAMYPDYFINKIKNGIHPTRSGDILIILEPSWTAYNHKGAKHGSFYQYDSHIPLIFYGFNLTPKVVNRYVEISDIASTLSTLLHILPPSGNMGMPIVEVLDAVSKEKSKTNRQGK